MTTLHLEEICKFDVDTYESVGNDYVDLATFVGPVFDEEGTTIAWIPRSFLILVANVNSCSITCQIRTKESLSCLRLGSNQSVGLSWRRKTNDLLLATGHRNGKISIYDANSGTLLTNLLSHTGIIVDLCFLPAKLKRIYVRIVSISTDKTLKIWDQENNAYNMSISLSHIHSLTSVAWSGNGTQLAVVGTERVIYIYDIIETSCILKSKFRGHIATIVSCQFSPNDALLVTASLDTRIHIWDIESKTVKVTLCHSLPLPSLLFSNSVLSFAIGNFGTVLASVCSSGSLRLWDVSSYEKGNISVPSVILDSNYTATAIRGSILAVIDGEKKVTLYKIITSPPNLMEFCRLSLRRQNVESSFLNRLQIPQTIFNYLNYTL